MNDAPVLPIHFANTLFINAAFPLPSSKTQHLLPSSSPLHLIEVFPGRAVLVVSFALYRQSPFGSYAEAVLSLMASHEKTTPVLTLAQLMQQSRYPAYVLHMLVNSQEARQMGDAIWGLPRILADVRMTEQAGQVLCEAAIEGQTVLQFVVERPKTDRARTMQIETYSQRNGMLLRSVMTCSARLYGRTQGGGATLSWGNHPIGQSLSVLEVSSLPLMMRFYDQMQAELGAPDPCTIA